MNQSMRQTTTGRASNGIPASASQGWDLAAPPSTHMRDITCRESLCLAHVNGWETLVPMDSVQADYIRRSSGRRFREDITGDNLSRFTFESGQECFERHLKRNDRDALYIRRIAHDSKLVETDRWLWDLHEETYKIKRERE